MPGFASATPDNGGHADVPIKNYRYQIPRYPLDGPVPADSAPIEGTGMLVPWTRVSTILDTHKDKEGVFKWTKRLVIKGLAGRPDLYALAAATRLDDRAGLDSISNQAFEFARGKASSNLGTALHNFREQVDAGEDVHIPEPWAADIAAYQVAMKAAGVRPRPDLQELVVVRPDLVDGDAGGLAGRFDLVVELWDEATQSYDLVVADLKTGSDPLLYGAWEIQQQLGTYTSAWAIWTGTHWLPMPNVRRDIALMIHLIPGKAECNIHLIHLDPTELEADLASAYRTRARRKATKSCHQLLSSAARRPAAEPTQADKLAPQLLAEARAEAGLMRSADLDLTGRMLGRTRTPVHELAKTDRPASFSPVQAETTMERHVRVLTSTPQTPQMKADAELAAARLARVDAMAKRDGRNDEGDDELEPATVAQVERQTNAALEQDGTGNSLAPMAGPGQRGCSVCGRTGHRKGSVKCLGNADPAPKAQISTDTPAQGPTDMGSDVLSPDDNPGHAGSPGELEDKSAKTFDSDANMVANGDKPCAHGAWTRDAMSGEWLCGVCGAPAAPDQSDALELGTEPDPFAEEVLSDREARWHEFLDRINEAKDKATIRAIREEATEAGIWDAELIQAGLKRIRQL